MDGLRGEVLQDLADVALVDFLVKDLSDFLSDSSNLRTQGVAGLSLLSLGALGEGNSEDSDDVAVLGLAVAVGFDKGSPLLNEVA